MSITALVPPSATNLLAVETVKARLGLADSDLAVLTPIVEEASGLVRRFLRFQPAYGLWQETFTGAPGQRLYFGARPLWRVNGVSDRFGTELTTTTYRVDTERHAIARAFGWSLDLGNPWLVDRVQPINLLGPTDTWDWTVEYEAGWWLETMAGDPPAGVGPLAPEVRRDFLAICRYLWTQESRDPTVRLMKDEGASVEFFAAHENDSDEETGLPARLTVGLAYWRRPK